MTAVPKTYYQILQVDPEASQEVISAAYRRLARIYHPDVNQSPGAARQMQRLNRAYEVLGDPDARAAYDAKLTEERQQESRSASHPSDQAPRKTSSQRPATASPPKAQLKHHRRSGDYIYFSIGRATNFYATLGAFKSRVPRRDRRYFPKNKEWRIDSKYGSVLSDLFSNYTPSAKRTGDTGPRTKKASPQRRASRDGGDGTWTVLRVIALLLLLSLVGWCVFNPESDGPAYSRPTPSVAGRLPTIAVYRNPTPTSEGAVPTIALFRSSADRDKPTLVSTPRPTAIRKATPFIHAVVRSDGNLNMRAGPGTEYAVLGKYAPGTKIRVYGRAPGDDWLKVRSPEATEGWMYRDYLELNMALWALPYVEVPPPALPPTAEPRQRAVCNCSGNVYNCNAFPTQRAAQACFEYCWRIVGYDIHWLDDDGDGVACEWNP